MPSLNMEVSKNMFTHACSLLVDNLPERYLNLEGTLRERGVVPVQKGLGLLMIASILHDKTNMPQFRKIVELYWHESFAEDHRMEGEDDKSSPFLRWWLGMVTWVDEVDDKRACNQLAKFAETVLDPGTNVVEFSVAMAELQLTTDYLPDGRRVQWKVDSENGGMILKGDVIPSNINHPFDDMVADINHVLSQMAKLVDAEN